MSYPCDIRGGELLLEQPCVERFSDHMITGVSVKGHPVWNVTLARAIAPKSSCLEQVLVCLMSELSKQRITALILIQSSQSFSGNLVLCCLASICNVCLNRAKFSSAFCGQYILSS